jgi:parvulin-like peptidyl-prolyl isomerase
MAISPALQNLAAKASLFRALPVLAAAVAVLSACHPKPPAVTDPNDPNFIVADKGDWTITRGELNNEVDGILKQQHLTRDQVPPANMPYVETKILRFMVVNKLFLDKAKTLQLKDVDKDAAAELDQQKGAATDQQFADALKQANISMDTLKQRVHDDVVARKILEIEAWKDVEPTEQQIDDIYLKNKDRFNIPPMIRASRVLILADEKDTAAQKADKQKAISAARERVIKGEDFGKVASDVSQDRSSAPKGGDMGKFPRGTNEPGFDEVAFKTKVNSVSPVFVTALGYQFIKVTDSQPAGTVSLADARALIGPRLLEANKEKKTQAYVTNLLANSGVNFHLKLVDPPAQMGGPGGPGGPGGSGEAPTEPAPAPDAPAPPPAPASGTPPPQ